MPETQPISWRSIVYGTPVTASDGIRIGAVREVLGSDSEDIFHGLRVALTGRRQDVMVDAEGSAGARDLVRASGSSSPAVLV